MDVRSTSSTAACDLLWGDKLALLHLKKKNNNNNLVKPGFVAGL